MTRNGSPDIADGSLAVAVVRDLRNLADWFKSSRVVQSYRAIARRLSIAAENARLAQLITTVVAWIRGSLLYHWLTKEPDPDVVVIDLRDTYTVAPVVTLLNRLLALLHQALRTSDVIRILSHTQDRVPWNALAESHTVRVLGAALAPQEPPEEE